MAEAEPNLHIAMYPWFAFGHSGPFLHLANRLAGKGHRISMIMPASLQSKLEQFNHHPDLISFISIKVPHVEGLPPGAESTAEVPFPLLTFLAAAMDNTRANIEVLLRDLKPNIILFDFTHWMPDLAHGLGIKSVQYSVVTAVSRGYIWNPLRQLGGDKIPETEFMGPPPGFPDSSIRLHLHESRIFAEKLVKNFGSDIRFVERAHIGANHSDAVAFRTCRELEAPFIDYLARLYDKPILLSGPIMPEPPTTTLDEKWAKWLSGFPENSVIYCAFGSECILKEDQFRELVLGIELTGMPFLVALKPPGGFSSVEEALPEGFKERVQNRGVVQGGWVQQQLILGHPSVGCFITHCGASSLAEAFVGNCQLVLIPNAADQITNARMLSGSIKVGLEVERGEEDGFYTKESVCKAVKTIMDEEGQVAREIRANYAKLREIYLNKDLESSYMETFTGQLQKLVG